ncbi:MAG: SHOCT domain-containing protein [Chloroflexi bacterium]|nr:SHOCT domain-containing protein [Chloroflexota bacterium]
MEVIIMMFFGGWMWILWIAVIGLIVWGVVAFTRRGESATKRTPLEIAKERYAKGEISKEEFEKIRKDLF